MITLTLQPTTKVVRFNGIPARIWEGTTDKGEAVVAFIARVALHNSVSDEEQQRFSKDLHEQRAPSEHAESFPTRMII